MPGVNLNWKSTLVLVGGGFILLWIIERQVKAGVTAAADATGNFVSTKLNPASDKNVIYTGVNSLIGDVTGNPNFNLGSALYNWWNPGVQSTGPGQATGATPNSKGSTAP